MDAASVLLVAGFVLAAFGPSILYLVWLRNTERFAREPWWPLARAFSWGAVGGVVLGIALSLWLGARPDSPDATALLYGAVVVAPVAEEFSKGLGLWWVRDAHPEPEDGLIYGAAAGLGFAATENLLYLLDAFLTGGFAGFAATFLVRSVASVLLHASASAFVGFAIWRMRLGHGGLGGVAAFYALAVLLHGIYNFAASIQLLVGFLFALALAIGVFRYLRRRIRQFDEAIATQPAAPPPIGP